MLKAYEDISALYNGNPVSATDHDRILSNTHLLQQMSNRATPIFSINKKLAGWEGRWSPGSIFWKGGFMYRIGMTTARFVLTSIKVAGSLDTKMKIIFTVNNVDTIVYDQLLATESKNIDISINARGWVDHTAVYVRAMLYGDSAEDAEPTNCTAYFSDAYCFPLSTIMAIPWPGIPTFTTMNESNVNQLISAQSWLAKRMALVPHVPILALRYWQGTYDTGKSITFYYGTVSPVNGNRRLKGNFSLTTWNRETYIRFTINGQTVDFGPYTTGNTYSVPVDIDLQALGCLDNVDYVFAMTERCVLGNPTNYRSKLNTRINTGLFYIGSNSYTNTPLPGSIPAETTMSHSDLLSYYTTIATVTNNIKSKIDNNSKVFDRARMFRDRFGVQPDQDEYWKTEMYARIIRRGDILWVSGKNVKIAYGPIETKITADNEKWEYTYRYEEDLIDGDAYQTKIFYLDQFKFVTYGQPYYIIGSEIRLVNEFNYDEGF